MAPSGGILDGDMNQLRNGFTQREMDAVSILLMGGCMSPMPSSSRPLAVRPVFFLVGRRAPPTLTP